MAPVEVVAEVPPVDASADANAARKKPRRRGRKSKGGAQAENVAGAVSESHEAAPIPAPVASVRDESATMEMPSSSSHGPRRHPVIPQGRVFGTVHDVVEDAPVGFDALDDEAKTYFKSIEELLTEDAMLLQSDEDRDLLLQNIYTEVDGKELLLAADYDGSRIMEKLIRVSSDFHRRVLMDRFRGRFRDLVQHRFASHVVQTLLTLGAQMVAQAADGSASAEQEKSATEGELLAMEQYILDFCGELQPYWRSVMTDAYGSHLLRLLLNILAGNALSNADAGGSSKGNNSFIRSKASKKFNDDATLALERAWMTQTRQVPPSFTAKLAEIVSELTAELSDADVRVLALHAIASPVLQALLVLHAADTPVADALIDRVLLGIASPAAVDGRLEQERAQWADILLKSQVGSHLFEKILQVASPAMFMRVFNTCFKDKTAQLARHCIGNYTVQSMLDEVKNKEQAQAVLEELMADVKHLVLRGRSGVVHKMLVVAGRFESKQGELMKSLQATFGADTEESKSDFVDYLLHLTPAAELAQDSQRPISAVGVQIVQSLLHFAEAHSKPVIESFLALPTSTTYAWTKHPSASRAFEAFLVEKNVSLEVKGKILHNLKGCFVDMAKDKYAGHIVDKCWAVANIEQKQSIATELLEGERELTTNYHGRHILRNCRIDQFKRQYDEWMAREVGIEKKRRLFEEFLDVSAVPAAVKPIKNVAPARAAAVAALRQTDKVDSSSDAKSAEIDLIFSSNGTFAPSVAPVRAVKYTATGSNATSVVKSTSKKAKKHDSDILDVLEAIDRSAGKKVKSKEAAKSIKEGALKKKEKSKKRTASESVSDMTSAKRKLSKKAKTEEQLKRRKFAS